MVCQSPNLRLLPAVKLRRIARREFAIASLKEPDAMDHRALAVSCRAELRARRRYASETLRRIQAIQIALWFA